MKPRKFRLHRPESRAEALAILAEVGDDAKVMAGGQSLVPLMNFRLASPGHVVDTSRIDELRRSTVQDGLVTLGATAVQRQVELDATLAAAVPVLPMALEHVGHPVTRNRGTIGGSVAHADPAAEMPAIAMLLDAVAVIESTRSTRRVPMAEFFRYSFVTAMEDDELLVALDLGVADPRAGWGFHEVARRPGDFAIVGAAAMARVENGSIADVRLSLFGAGSTPVRFTTLERGLVGTDVADAAALEEFARSVLAEAEPHSDVHASADYRRDVGATCAVRALDRAINDSRRQPVGSAA